MSNVFMAGSTDQYVDVKVWSISDGSPKTDITHSTSGLSIRYQIGNSNIQEAAVGSSPSPASMSAGGSHADWGIYHRGNGWYKIGLPDAVIANAGDHASVWIELTDFDSSSVEIFVAGYDGSLSALGAATAADVNAVGIAVSSLENSISNSIDNGEAF